MDPNMEKTFNALKNYSLVELNSLSAEEITSVLNNIADQLLTADISRIKVDTEDYWLSWQNVYKTIRDNLVR